MPDKEYRIRIVTVADGAGAKDTSRELEDLGKAGRNAHEGIAEAAEHAHLKHRDLHAGVRQLHHAFPELAAVAHAALNPIGLAVAALVGAFEWFHKRVESLRDALAGLELPNVTPAEIGHITAAAQAYEQLAEAIKKGAESYHTIDAASDRALGKIKTHLEETKQLLSAQKGHELANLEAKRDGMSPEEYNQAKGVIEARYARAGIEADQKADQQTLFQKAWRSTQLGVDSQGKLKQAGRIKVASAEDDAITERDLKAQADAAQKRIEEGRKWISDLDELPTMSAWEKAKFIAKYHWEYSGTDPGEVRRLQEQGIANAQPPIDRYNAFLRSKAERERLRKRRSDLQSSAAAEGGEAAAFDESFPDELSGVRHRNAMGDVESAVATAQSLEHGQPTSGAARAQLQSVASKIAGQTMSLEGSTQMMDFAAKSIINFTKTVERLANAMSRIGTDLNSLDTRLNRVERSPIETRTLPGSG